MVGLKLSFIYLFLLLTNSVYAQNLDNSIYLKNLQLQRKLFLQAENELKNHKNIKACESVIQKYSYNLSNYPLFPYLKFMALQQSINEISLSQLKNFISNYNDMPLISQLKNSWLIHAAKQQKWQNFLEIYQDNKDNVELECYFIQSQYRSNQDLIKFDEAIKKIWLNGNCLPKSCDVVFEQWKQQGLMTKPMIWQRIKLAINNNNIALARFLANNHLPKIEHPIVELWIKVDNNPWLIIKKNYFVNINHPAISEILMHGILKIAKKESDKAVKIWQHLSVMHKFTERHFNYIVKAIASSLAKESHPNAWEWLNKIHHDYKDQEIYNLQLVLALKQSRWDRIIKIYETELPNNFKEQEKWLYWYARSLEMQNRPIEGKNILIGLSNKRSYYGFLSSAKLLRPYSFKFKAVNINASQIEAVLKNKSVQRAYELLQIDRINKASQEWSFALKNMVEWELHAAAKLADSLNIPNWAITALSDAKQQDDLSLRFPKHYSQHIVNEAKKNQLDPAWVFAVTRQESAFKPYVKSYAGALGLMQLMPQTGYMVAKTINLHLRNHYDILDINNNVKLGSKYLQLMLNRYKNMVVATAAYNAGPGRVCKWLPPHDIAADIWVETIPFKDTKEYVQNVMAHTVIYQKLLGNNHYLNMPLIKKI
jgi:soluble lytic murein transglycosylase